MLLEKMIAPNSLRPIKDRLKRPLTEITPELLQVINQRIGNRARSRYLFDEWYEEIDNEGKSRRLRGSPSELNVVLFREPIDGRYYCFVALRQAKVGELGFYQIWELSPPSQ